MTHSLAAIAIPFLVALALGYRFYARRVARVVGVDDAKETPAHRLADGVDYVAAPPFYLFGQHFSAIAAAGPIAGPILACQAFGWAPCLLWIGVGVILIGAVHDFTVLAASVRHEGRTIVEITRERLGTGPGRAMLAFIWIALLYVVVAFAEIIAQSFVVGTEELQSAQGNTFHPGGAVAFASTAYLLIAVVLGLVQRFLRPPLWLATIVFVPAALGVSWLGTECSHLLQADARTWALILLAYCGVASVLPVWSLLQPRGYLGGFVLYTALALGLFGVLFGGYGIEQPAFRAFDTGGTTSALFPFLFVTIACGACSGFHGLVCSGTTSKQIARESHMCPVGYGGMLAEGMVALFALVTIMIVSDESARGLAPGTIYGNGIGHFLALLVGEQHLGIATTFGALAFSTFVFDTLDVCTRLGRYVLQELFGWRGMGGAIAATALTVAAPAAVLMVAPAGSWRDFWTLFGASNQLLAALSLLLVTAWLQARGRSIWFTLPPLVFLLVMTGWALVRIIASGFVGDGSHAAVLNAACATALLLLTAYLVRSTITTTRARRGLVPGE